MVALERGGGEIEREKKRKGQMNYRIPHNVNLLAC
jgi:hypothetical protein